MRKAALIFLTAILLATNVRAFSLLGPFEPWMDKTNSLRLDGDIGGALDINEEYRWNLPVVTYGFDESFVDYFGSNGVVAIEQAIQILNALPPASNVVLSNYPLGASGFNYQAQALGVCDLKSMAFNLLVEQMGLAAPTRHVFDLRRWDSFLRTYSDESWWEDWVYEFFIWQRNFDPESHEVSHYVNETLISGFVVAYSLDPFPSQADVVEFQVDPLSPAFPSVREGVPYYSGMNYTGLSRDDAGGLRYLLSSNNINAEQATTGVAGADTNAVFVNVAARPGVEKITFVRHPVDSLSGGFLRITNQFTDRYLTNGALAEQLVERASSRPDILFFALDTGLNSPNTPLYTRSGTSNWLNNAALNGNPTKAGPGIIQPPVNIIFNRESPRICTADDYSNGEVAWLSGSPWGSFDNSTNAPIVYPTSPPAHSENLIIRLHFYANRFVGPSLSETFNWRIPVPFGGAAMLQTSTNLSTWTNLTLIMNRGGVVEWQHFRASSQRYFRAIPQ